MRNRRLIILALSGILSACGHFAQDVSGNAALWDGYRRDGIYELQQDVFIAKGFWGQAPELSAPNGIERLGMNGYRNDIPQSFEKWRTDPGRYPEILGILGKGTRLRCVRIERQGERTIAKSATFILIYATLLDDPAKEYNITFLSTRRQLDGMVATNTPDPLLLTPVNVP